MQGNQLPQTGLDSMPSHEAAQALADLLEQTKVLARTLIGNRRWGNLSSLQPRASAFLTHDRGDSVTVCLALTDDKVNWLCVVGGAAPRNGLIIDQFCGM